MYPSARSMSFSSLSRLLLISIFTFAFAGPNELAAQVSSGGIPYSFKLPVKKAIDVVVMPPIDLTALSAEDSRDLAQGKPFRFGYGFDVDLAPDNSGVWEELPGGGRLWRLCLSCPGAYSINLIFSEFRLPPGAQLFVYDAQKRVVLGAFTSRNNKPYGTFATAPTPGDTCWVEYYEPAGVEGSGKLAIGRVVHGYRNIFFGKAPNKEFNDSGVCQMNVHCPEAADLADQVRAVGMILCGGGMRCCTGVLLNNVRQDRTPYFLTSRHCLQGETPADWVVIFNYESPDCSNKDGPTTDSVSGARLRAQSDRADFALVELSEVPPPSYNVYYAGWSRYPKAPDHTAAVHHPRGDIKKIARDVQAPEASAVGQLLAWKIQDWEVGAMEPGSEGAPLFDPEGHVIGQFSLGTSSCQRDGFGPDYFGRFGVAWDGGDPRSRLRDWLDPDGTDPTTLDGFEPYTPPSLSVLQPQDGDLVFGVLTIKAQASDPDGIDRVEFYIQGDLAATDTTPPYEHSWDTASIDPGDVVIRVVAFSTTGLRSEVSLTVTVTRDCNQNGTPDPLDIENGTSSDCNENGVPDECDIAAGVSNDCNGNGIPDECDLRAGAFGLEAGDPLQLDSHPTAVTVADLNSDGLDDLLVAASDPNKLYFLVKQQDGSFASDTVDLPGPPLSIAAADLDGDSDIDAAVTLDTTRDNVITVLGAGDGTVDKVFRLTVGPQPRGLAVADLENDGDKDLVVACEGAGQIFLLLNFGNAAFAQDVFSTEAQPVVVAASDFDGDGDQDLIYSERGVEFLLLLLNPGDGAFTEPQVVPAAQPGAAFAGLLACDLTSDGIPDVAVTNEATGELIVLRGAGDGTFEALQTLSVGSGPRALAARDIDNDQAPDLAVLNTGDKTLRVLLNDGKGGFAARDPVPCGPEPSGVALLDVTGSLLPDVVVAAKGGTDLLVVANTGSPSISKDCNGNAVPDECDIAEGRASDCNQNGIPDDCDIRAGVEQDENGNGIPDSCEGGETLFKRGDPNGDGRLNVADAIFILGYAFGGGPAPSCLKGADTNDDGRINVADAIYLLGYAFGGGPPPPPPFESCGTDPTPDDLSCESFPQCQ